MQEVLGSISTSAVSLTGWRSFMARIGTLAWIAGVAFCVLGGGVAGCRSSAAAPPPLAAELGPDQAAARYSRGWCDEAGRPRRRMSPACPSAPCRPPALPRGNLLRLDGEGYLAMVDHAQGYGGSHFTLRIHRGSDELTSARLFTDIHYRGSARRIEPLLRPDLAHWERLAALGWLAPHVVSVQARTAVAPGRTVECSLWLFPVGTDAAVLDPAPADAKSR
jgi:hypothetical protein